MQKGIFYYRRFSKENGIFLQMQEAIYFDFQKNWDKFVPFLTSQTIKKVRTWICKQILESPSCSFFLGSLEGFSDDEKVRAIDELAWGKFSWYGFFSPTDFDDFLLVAKDEYDDPFSLGHFLWGHNCHIIACFVWSLCKLVFPERHWRIAWNSQHAYVVDELETRYDLLSVPYKKPISCGEGEKVEYFTEPVKFLSKMFWGIPEGDKTPEQMELEIREEETRLLKEDYDDFCKELFRESAERKIASIPFALELQKVFSE